MIEEPSDEFCGAFGAMHHPDNPKPREDRNAAEAMLQRVKEGETDDEAWLFMRRLAESILAAGGKGTPAGRRADRVLNATGLAGKYAHNQKFAREATVLQGFDGFTKASAIKGAGIYDDATFTARKRIDSYLKQQERRDHVSKLWSSASP